MRQSHTVARTLAIGGVASLVILSVTAPIIAAAGGTTLSVVPESESIAPGETTTIQVVVDSTDGGAGAAEFRLALDDASTAEVVDVTVLGSARVTAEMADDASWIDVEYAFQDTADTGSVVIAEVAVKGVDTGATVIRLEPAAGNDAIAVYDEDGTGYSVTGTNSARLSVETKEGQQSGDVSSPDTASNSGGEASDGAGVASNDASGARAEQSSGVETSTQSRTESGLLDNITNPVGIAAVVLVVFLIGLALGRR